MIMVVTSSANGYILDLDITVSMRCSRPLGTPAIPKTRIAGGLLTDSANLPFLGYRNGGNMSYVVDSPRGTTIFLDEESLA